MPSHLFTFVIIWPHIFRYYRYHGPGEHEYWWNELIAFQKSEQVGGIPLPDMKEPLGEQVDVLDQCSYISSLPNYHHWRWNHHDKKACVRHEQRFSISGRLGISYKPMMYFLDKTSGHSYSPNRLKSNSLPLLLKFMHIVHKVCFWRNPLPNGPFILSQTTPYLNLSHPTLKNVFLLCLKFFFSPFFTSAKPCSSINSQKIINK